MLIALLIAVAKPVAAQQESDAVVQRHKVELEVQKLELEVKRLNLEADKLKVHEMPALSAFLD